MNGQQLKNSILQMAVQGKLVPQDPNDEPASVLVERIRAEKEHLIKEKKIKKDKNPSYIFRGADNLPYEQVGNNAPVCIVEEVPFDIPESWAWIRLGSFSTYADTKKKIKANIANKDLWGLDLEDIEKGGRLLAKKKVGDRKATGDKTLFEKGDILYSKLRPYLLKIMIADEDGICTPEIVPFKVFGNVNPEYIVAYLKSPYVDDVINSVTYGVKMPRVGTETMTGLLVPLPPLSEQDRIIAKIKEVTPALLSYNAKEKEHGLLQKGFSERLKKSILQWAVQGKLVPQDPSDEPASVLLERIREEKARLVMEGKIKKDKNESIIFRRDNSHYEKLNGKDTCIDDEIPFDVPASWMWCRLRDIMNIVSARRVHQSDWKTSGVPFFRAREIGKLAEYGSVDNELFISEELYENFLQNGVPHVNDLMVTAVGALGKTYVVKDTDRFYYKDASVLCFENFSGINPHYIKLLLSSPFMEEQIKDNSSGTTVGTITIIKAANYLIPIPPLKEQSRIVSMYDTLQNSINRI